MLKHVVQHVVQQV